MVPTEVLAATSAVDVADTLDRDWESAYQSLLRTARWLNERFPNPAKQGVDVEEMMSTLLRVLDSADRLDPEIRDLASQVRSRV